MLQFYRQSYTCNKRYAPPLIILGHGFFGTDTTKVTRLSKVKHNWSWQRCWRFSGERQVRPNCMGLPISSRVVLKSSVNLVGGQLSHNIGPLLVHNRWCGDEIVRCRSPGRPVRFLRLDIVLHRRQHGERAHSTRFGKWGYGTSQCSLWQIQNLGLTGGVVQRYLSHPQGIQTPLVSC